MLNMQKRNGVFINLATKTMLLNRKQVNELEGLAKLGQSVLVRARARVQMHIRARNCAHL